MDDAISGTQAGIAVELRPGVLGPDWSVVTFEAASDALRARDASRPNLAEKWAVALDDAEDRIWQTVIKLFVELGRAPRSEDIVITSGLDGDNVAIVLRKLQHRDLLGLSDSGEVLHAYPFTSRQTEHIVELGGHGLNALCAIDALGAGAMCGRDIVIQSRCRACGAPIRILTANRGESLNSVTPPGTVVWHDLSYAGTAAASCCPRIAFFCSDQHLNEWLGTTPSRTGRRLSADEALQVGRAIIGPVLEEPGRLAQA
ncbi:MAG: alkylmercury lyase family protein [Rhizobiales bacterium]|nr:alkylmercury lyase family protein [Hyphomicrobiales bacterium]